MRTELRAALQAADARRVAFAAHKFKGSAGTVGATTLAELCSQLEQRARQGSLDELDGLDGLIADLETAADAVRTALRGRCPPVHHLTPGWPGCELLALCCFSRLRGCPPVPPKK